MNVRGLVGLGVFVGIVAMGAAMWADAMRAGAEATTPAWRAQVAVVDDTLARGDISAAVRAWHDAYGAAMGSREWIAMMEVGDAFRRIGEAAHTGDGAKPNSRRAYAVGLARARHAQSVAGVLRAAQSFAALGDREVATTALEIADRLARAQADEAARARVQVLSRTLATTPR